MTISSRTKHRFHYFYAFSVVGIRLIIMKSFSFLLLTLLVSDIQSYPSNQPIIGVLLETVLDHYHECKGKLITETHDVD